MLDADGSPTYVLDFLYEENSTTFSQDMRLIGLNEKTNWLVAASFFSEAIENTQAIVFDDHVFVGGVPIGENELGFNHPTFSVCDSISDELLGPCNTLNREDNPNKGRRFQHYHGYSFRRREFQCI